LTTRARRLWTSAALALVAVAVVVGAAITGAVTAPPPLPDQGVALAEEMPPETSPVATNGPRRHAALGIIVAISSPRIAIKVKSQVRPVVVNVGANAILRLNGKPATLDDYHIGDVIAVVGRPGPRGALMARTAMVLRKPRTSAQSLLQTLAAKL